MVAIPERSGGSGRSRFGAKSVRIAAVVAALFGSGAAFGGASFAAEKVGEAASIENIVSGQGVTKGLRRLAVSDAVFRSERISAGPASHGEILLNDNSRIIVGENSTVALDNFVIAGENFSNLTVNVAKGAFRFVTGNTDKKAIKIITPVGNIGVRGTLFDVYVDPVTRATRVLVYKGAVTVCTKLGRKCIVADRSCDIVEVESGNKIERLPFLRSAARTRANEAAAFPLAEQQQRFGAGFQAPLGGCYARAAFEAANSTPTHGNGPEDTVVPEPPIAPPPPDDCAECGD